MKKYLVVGSLFLVLLLAAAPTLAQEPTGPAAAFEPGNYCASCHTAGDDRPAHALEWTGSINRQVVNPCPALTTLQEEIYYTDRLLLAIDRASATLPQRADTAKIAARVAATRQTYSRLLDTPVSSLDAFSAEAAVLRFKLGQSYRQVNAVDTAVKQQYVLIAAIGVTLLLLSALVWGWRQLSRAGAGSRWPLRPGFKAVFLLGGIFILFALPIFRVFTTPVQSASAEEQARQTTLDTAGRTADTADRVMARAWELARVGAAWHEANPAAAATALASAETAAREKQLNFAALWGEVQTVYEGIVGSEAAQAKAYLVADRLNASNSRAWALRLMAAEWTPVDPGRAAGLLDEALAVANSNSGIYRELDVRAIAVTWAALDPARAVELARRVYDPGLRAWALVDIAKITGDTTLYDRAAEAARQVAAPAARAYSLRRVATASGNSALFGEALAALEPVADETVLAYALSDLAAASGDAALVARISPAYPDARAAALYRLGRFEEAWAAAAAITDPLDRAHAQAAIAGAWRNADAARQVADPTLRDLALRDIAIAGQDAALATSIESPYYKVQALTALGQVEPAQAAASELSDTYPLRALGVALAESDPPAALALIDRMDREADKADVLRAAAAADPALFERALGMALAARVRGDALAPVEASLALARSLAADPVKAEAAYQQAYTAAEQISTK